MKKQYPQKINIKTVTFSDYTQPLLSICIPTFNRSAALDNTLQLLTEQAYFKETDNVEIIISDNCSSDDTAEIAKKYTDLYPKKVRYYRNDENIWDRNFEKVLSYGKGLYMKLCNDTLIYHENSLENMCQDIIKFLPSKPLLYFSAGFVNTERKYSILSSMNEFLSKASYGITAIGNFGIWKEDFDEIKDFSRKANKNLAQVDVLLRVAEKKKISAIVNEVYFHFCI